MRKLCTMAAFALFVATVQAQSTTGLSEKEYWRQMKALSCRGNENLEQCKARIRREKIEAQRYKDSIARERQAERDANARAEWEAEKDRRSKLTPEERQKEDEQTRLDEEAKKKKTEEGTDFLAGAIFSTRTGTAPDYNPVLGLLIGARTRVPLSQDLGLSVGIEYSMQGGKYESHEYIPGGDYGTSSAISRLTYLNFPLMAHYQREGSGFFAEAGLQPGILLSAKNKGSDIKDAMQKIDLGIPIGAGYKFKNKFGVALRIAPGLMNVNKDKENKSRNMVASLRASYSL
jgi:hypothetical protein